MPYALGDDEDRARVQLRVDRTVFGEQREVELPLEDLETSSSPAG